MDVRKESHVAAALKYIEENLPVGEEGLYGLVNNAGVSLIDDGKGDGDDPLIYFKKATINYMIITFGQVCVCGEFDWQTWGQVLDSV